MCSSYTKKPQYVYLMTEYMTRTTDPPNIIIVDWSKLGKEDLPNTITGLISYLPLYFKVILLVRSPEEILKRELVT